MSSSEALTGETQPVEPTPGPRPHRCNARLEDLIQSLPTFEFDAKIRPAFRNFRACLASEEGQEPDVDYLMIKDPSAYLEPAKIFTKRARDAKQ